MIGSIISAVIVLLIVIGMYMAVSYNHSKSGLSKGCNGNCASCHMKSDKCKNEADSD